MGKGISLISFFFTFLFIMASLLIIYIVLKTLSFLSSISTFAGIDPFSVEIKYSTGRPMLVAAANSVYRIAVSHRLFSVSDWSKFLAGEENLVLLSQTLNGFGFDVHEIKAEGGKAKISRLEIAGMPDEGFRVAEESYVHSSDFSEEIIIPGRGVVYVIQVGG